LGNIQRWEKMIEAFDIEDVRTYYGSLWTVPKSSSDYMISHRPKGNFYENFYEKKQENFEKKTIFSGKKTNLTIILKIQFFSVQ